MDWFLYYRYLCHERVKTPIFTYLEISTNTFTKMEVHTVLILCQLQTNKQTKKKQKISTKTLYILR